ncbi:MAG: hypothetical protein ACYTFG_22080 [Planctomycetota bacterium]|jgi:hypothetical protein
MPSKSDIQFGKIVVANHFATKEEVEASIREQAQYERERHTIILEGVLLFRDFLTLEQVEAIQKRMKRRVIFCPKCHGKFNVFQFRGSEKFLCHKCGNKVIVPDGDHYRNSLKEIVDKVMAFFEGAPEPAPEAPEPKERKTIMLKKEDLEAGALAGDDEDVLEPAEEVEGAIEEVEVDGVLEEEPAEEPPLLLEDEITPDGATPADGVKGRKAKKGKAAKPPKGLKKPRKLKKKKAKADEGEKPKSKSGKLKKKKEPREGKRLKRKR